MPRVSVIISNRNDVAMLAVTVRSALEELSAVPGGGEVVIVDNSDEEYVEAVKAVIPARYQGKEVKLLRQDFPCLFTAREDAAREAKGDYIFCVDSHMIFGHNSIINAVHFMNRKKCCPVGFGSIPVNWLCQHEGASRHDMRHVHGTWGKLYKTERRISWKGMPWICRRDWFLDTLGGYGALSANKLSWGGGDMYLGVKSWLLGYENWAIPSRPIIHIGPLPVIARKLHPYRLYRDSGRFAPTLGFLIAFYALGVEDDFFDRKEIVKFLEYRVGANFKENLPWAKEMAQEDRKWIAQRARYNYHELERVKPWEDPLDYHLAAADYGSKFKLAKALKEEDWILFQNLIKQYKIRSILEFGSGISTMLFSLLKIPTTSFETDKEYMLGVKALCDGYSNFFHWNNKEHFGISKTDFVLVDGIDPRDVQIDVGMSCSDKILVHDGYSAPTKGFIAEKLKDWKEIKVKSVRSRFFIKP